MQKAATKFIVLTAAGTLAYFAFGWLVFDYILGAYTDRNTTHLQGFKKNEAQFSFPFLILSCAAYAALIVYILTVVTKTTSVSKGALTASAIGVLVAVMTDSYWYASSNFYNTIAVALADVAAVAVTVGLLGAVVTFLSNRYDGFDSPAKSYRK